MPGSIIQLVSYIAPAAPATRRPAEGDEPPVRPEVGFTPAWFRQHLDIDFGRRWHDDPAYRRETVLAMRAELRRRFPDSRIARIDQPDSPLDLLTGVYGGCPVAAIYGVPIVYAADQWPQSERRYLDDDAVDRLTPPDLDANPFWERLMAQVDWIAGREGEVRGYLNWQGVLNNAERLRGPQLFIDMVERPERARRLFACVTDTMIEAARRLHERQRASGWDVRLLTVSNCLVNMVSPAQYAELLAPCDRRIAASFEAFGVHNCAWRIDPYAEHYARLPRVGYIDMGLDSHLRRARELFPEARRAVMYTPMDLANKPLDEVRRDFRRAADELAPCDLVLADIDAGVPDGRVRAALEWCAELSRRC